MVKVIVIVVPLVVMLLLTLILDFIFQERYSYWSIFFSLPTVFSGIVLVLLMGWKFFSEPMTLEAYRASGWQTVEKSNVQKADSLALVYFKSSSLTYKSYTFYYQKTTEDSLFYKSYYFFREKTNKRKAPFEFLLLHINKNFVVSGLVEKKILSNDIAAARLLNNYFRDQAFFSKLQQASVDTASLSKKDLELLNNYLKGNAVSDTVRH